jgi:hypothetical protein
MQFTFHRLAALALAGCALLAPAAEASLVYNDGDVLLAVRATSNPNSTYLYDLGPGVNFANFTTQQTLSLGILGDLTNTFGANWATRGDLFWSVSGVQKFADTYNANTMFMSAPHGGALILGTSGSAAWDAISSFQAGQPAGKIQDMGNRYKLSNGDGVSVQSANNNGLIQPNVGPANSYRSYLPGGGNTVGSTAFTIFGNNGIEGNFAGGPSLASLDFYVLEPGSGAAATFEGNFSVDSNAVVTFTPTGVPEPASLGVLAAGALVLGSLRRRSTATAH